MHNQCKLITIIITLLIPTPIPIVATIIIVILNDDNSNNVIYSSPNLNSDLSVDSNTMSCPINNTNASVAHAQSMQIDYSNHINNSNTNSDCDNDNNNINNNGDTTASRPVQFIKICQQLRRFNSATV